MFARLLRIQTKVDEIDEVAKLFKEKVIPLCKNQKGYKEAYFLAERDIGHGVLITLWETEEDMMATEHSRFFQEQLVKFMKFFTAPPIRESYEVVIKE
ncbi:MAG: antibiotic biosynthesis monooxygenase [Candidatus Aminicenantes bacterium]|nr:MAG: antibiotic biosynthesis monooxygenase [Candidatus Aminicenantes bacterium]